MRRSRDGRRATATQTRSDPIATPVRAADPAVLTSTTPASLGGIALAVSRPQRYLRVLREVVRDRYADLPTLVSLVEHAPGEAAESGGKPAPNPATTIGYYGDLLLNVLDREWHDHAEQEFDAGVQALEARGLLANSGATFIWGAGACRLAAHLTSRHGARHVTCADLSWLALYFGRELIHNRTASLPSALRRDRLFYRPTAAGTALEAERRASRFVTVDTVAPSSIDYVVRNAFELGEPVAADTIVLPYVLDAATGARAITMLIRLCEQAKVGQTLIAIVTCFNRMTTADGRDPAPLLRTLEQCGFSVERCDLVELPYSFACVDYGRVRMYWQTLLVKAIKTRAPSHETIRIVPPSANAAATPGERSEDAHETPAAAEVAAACLDAARERVPFRPFVHRLQDRYAETSWRVTVGDLLASGAIELACD